MSFFDWFSDPFVEPERPAIGPRLHAIPHQAPSRDAFEAWRDDPTTMFVMAALLRNAEECREEWLRKSWHTGEADQTTLVGLRERADALLGFTADYEAFCSTLGLDPEPEEEAAA